MAPFAGFVAMLAAVVAIVALVLHADNQELEQYKVDCAAKGAAVQQVGPELLLCVTDDGRVVTFP